MQISQKLLYPHSMLFYNKSVTAPVPTLVHTNGYPHSDMQLFSAHVRATGQE